MGRVEEPRHQHEETRAEKRGTVREEVAVGQARPLAPEGRSVWPLARAVTSPARAACGGSPSCAGPSGGAGSDGRCAPPAASRACASPRSVTRALLGRASEDRGAATAEYAIATMAAVAFAGLLVVILQSDEVRGMLLDLVRRALTYDR